MKKFGFPAAIGMAALSTTLLALPFFCTAAGRRARAPADRGTSYHGEGYYSHGGAPQITARHRRED